jgi:hypothetical protein
LCDVHPDGASLRVTYGVLDLTHREGHEFPAQLEPGRRYTARIQLNDVAFAFPPGHRIRVALSTAYWPMIWPSPKRATLSVLTGNSSIALPVRSPRPEDTRLAPLPPSDSDSLRVRSGVYGGRGGRQSGRSIGEGETWHRSIREPSVTRIERIGVELQGSGFTEFRIKDNDPLSARAFTRREQTYRRGEWQARVELETTLAADGGGYLLQARLRAFESGRVVCEREWKEDVPRQR